MSVEEDYPKSRIHSFLEDIVELCKKHKVDIYSANSTTILDFTEWEKFTELEASPTSSSVYWPRIETHIAHKEKTNGIK